MTRADRVVGVVLAAGAGRRFGGSKLLARLEGRPLVEHVVRAAESAGLRRIVAVLPPGRAGDELDQAVDWGDAVRVRNPDPARGLASSVRVGLESVAADADAAIVLLGDQPRVDPADIRALLDAGTTTPIVAVGRNDGAPNPVVVRRAAFDLADRLSGDRGFGPLLRAEPDLVTTVPAVAANPDVDTPADLASLIEAAWADRVRANRAQVDRVREVTDGPDFYATVSSLFVTDPRRTDDPVLDALVALAQPGDRWLDIGAGPGRFALPLALRVREVVALDPSTSMLAALRDGVAAHHIDNVRIVEGRWPPEPGGPAAGVRAEVTLAAHVGYDIEEIGSFLEAMERTATRACVVMLMERTPASVAEPFWPPVHGEARIPLPAMPEMLELLEARRCDVDVQWFDLPPRTYADRDELLRFLRRQTWVEPGGAKDAHLVRLLDARLEEADGGVRLVGQPAPRVGLATWPAS